MTKKGSKSRADLSNDVPTLTDGVFECVSYHEVCKKESGNCPRLTQKCPIPAGMHDMRLACITVWSNDTTNGVKVSKGAKAGWVVFFLQGFVLGQDASVPFGSGFATSTSERMPRKRMRRYRPKNAGKLHILRVLLPHTQLQ